MNELLPVLEETLGLVEQSHDSLWSPDTVPQLSSFLRSQIGLLKRGLPIDRQALSTVFLPTGSLQDVSIDSGWGQRFIELAAAVDRCLGLRGVTAHSPGYPDYESAGRSDQE